MDIYLLALGWWNFIGSIMMIGFFHQSFGKKMLNEWTKIFTTDFSLDYWGKLWLMWAIGLNIFFGLINILSVKWGYNNVKVFLIWADIIAYAFFIGLALWGLKVKRCGSGIYAAFFIFFFWIIWGFLAVE